MEFVTNIMPNKGDQIRVNRGLYSHHGIYIGDNKVIQFGSITGELDPSMARVIETTLEEFLNGGILEVATYSEEELNKKRSPDEIVNIAKSRLGEAGYDIISNNCEHFSNECVFGEKKSSQADFAMSLLANLFK